MTQSRGIAFVGPSLPAEEVRALDPSLLVLPPAAMGDLVSAVRQCRPHAVALIDGTFRQNLSVFHKEILWAMAEGVWIIGASSMGALRAAELHQHGMIGVGRVFEWYASGRLHDDDEVALTHAGPELGHCAVSDPMVTIRSTLDRAVEIGVLDRPQADHLAGVQKSRYFPQRSLRSILDDVDRLHDRLGDDELARLSNLIESGGVDVKREDALEAILVLQRHTAAPMPPELRPEHPAAATFEGTLERDVVVGGHDGLPVSFDAIRRHSALHDPRYAASWRDAVATATLVEVASAMGIEPDDEDRAAAARLVHRRLTDDDDSDAAATLQRLDMTAADLVRMVDAEATVLRFERWLASASGYTRSTQAFIDRVRLEGRYADLRTEAGLFEQLAAKSENDHVRPSLERLMALHSSLTEWPIPPDVDRYIVANQLGSRAELYDRLLAGLLAYEQLTDIELPLVDERPDVDTGPIATRGHQG